MKHKYLSFLLAIMLIFPQSTVYAQTVDSPSDGYLLYHAYSTYDAVDSKLYIQDLSTNKVECLSDKWNHISHAMNGDFGKTNNEFVFMAITNDEWDVFYYNRRKDELINLTEGNGYRDEDPKFSPDGKKVIFKQGIWNHERDDFVYTIMEIDIESKQTREIISSYKESAMPYYTEDMLSIFYTKGVGSECEIWNYNFETKIDKLVYGQENVQVYYPIVYKDSMYFSRWFSEENHSDIVVKYDMNTNSFLTLPFATGEFDCSDYFPVTDSTGYLCCNINGSYDLYYYNGVSLLELENLNTNVNELGVCYISETIYGDINGDKIINIFDCILLRKYLIYNPAPLNYDMSADFNNDGFVNVSDCVSMTNFLLNI